MVKWLVSYIVEGIGRTARRVVRGEGGCRSGKVVDFSDRCGAKSTSKRDLARIAEIWRDFLRWLSRQISGAISANLACVSANLACTVGSFFMTRVAARLAAADKWRTQRR